MPGKQDDPAETSISYSYPIKQSQNLSPRSMTMEKLHCRESSVCGAGEGTGVAPAHVPLVAGRGLGMVSAATSSPAFPLMVPWDSLVRAIHPSWEGRTAPYGVTSPGPP